jgi:deoxyadenosine/deoxycytidine kinase
VQERLPQEHIQVFGQEFRAQGFLSGRDIALFERLEKTTTSLLAPPDLLIYLEADPQTAFARLKSRARKAEADVSLEYLEALGTRYEQFIGSWHLCPVLRVDTQELDVRRDQDLRQVTDLVIRQLSSANGKLDDR